MPSTSKSRSFLFPRKLTRNLRCENHWQKHDHWSRTVWECGHRPTAAILLTSRPPTAPRPAGWSKWHVAFVSTVAAKRAATNARIQIACNEPESRSNGRKGCTEGLIDKSKWVLPPYELQEKQWASFRTDRNTIILTFEELTLLSNDAKRRLYI